MRIERTKNATRNIISGVFLKVYQIFIPFAMRTAMIYFMGVEYLGLSGLFTSILQVLNIAELGVSNAMVFSMYKAIAEDDKKLICALMKLYRLYYSVIGLVIAFVGVVLIPFLPQLVSGDTPPDINLYILYLLNLGTCVASYWLFAYKSSLLQAHQRVDIINNITAVVNTIQYGLQFLVLWIFKDYYLYVIVALVTQLLNNILTAVAASHLYPEYKPIGAMERKERDDINRRVKNLFFIKVGTIIINSSSTIIISAFLGLTTLAIYQNYFYLITSVIALISTIFNAVLAGIGNSLIVETKEKNYHDFLTITFLVQWVICFCTTCFMCLFQPFIEVWIGEEFLLPDLMVICFGAYFYTYEINQILCVYKDAAGIWGRDKYRSWLTAFANLVISIFSVRIWGLYGVILSTVISLAVVGMPWLIYNLFSTVFERKYMTKYVLSLLGYFMVTVAAITLSCLICLQFSFSPTKQLACNLLVCFIVPNLLFYLVYKRTDVMRLGINQVNKMLGGRLNVLFKCLK